MAGASTGVYEFNSVSVVRDSVSVVRGHHFY